MAESDKPGREGKKPEQGARARFRNLVHLVDCDLLVRDVTEPFVAPREPREGIVVKYMEDPADPLVERFPPQRRKYARRCLGRGDLALLALDTHADDAVAGWWWCTKVSHRDPYSGTSMHLRPDEAYFYDIWVDPSYRHAGVVDALGTAIGILCVDPATARAYTQIDRDNIPSMTVATKYYGFRMVQSFKGVRIRNRVGMRLPFSTHPRTGALTGLERIES